MAIIWAPSSDVLCQFLTPYTGPADICFPGNFCLSAMRDALMDRPSISDMVLKQLAQVGPAMAPLKPVFDIIDTALAIFRCVTAVPDAITNLDPTELFACVPELVEKINNLLALIPQLSLPRLIRSLLSALAALLRGFADDLDYLKRRMAEIAAAMDRAADLSDVTWAGFLSCAHETCKEQAMTMAEAIKGIGRIILLANLLMSLFGGPEIPCFSAMLDNLDEIDPVIDALRLLATLIEYIVSLIPDLAYALTLVLGDMKC